MRDERGADLKVPGSGSMHVSIDIEGNMVVEVDASPAGGVVHILLSDIARGVKQHWETAMAERAKKRKDSN
jgi:hypothetical protein